MIFVWRAEPADGKLKLMAREWRTKMLIRRPLIGGFFVFGPFLSVYTSMFFVCGLATFLVFYGRTGFEVDREPPGGGGGEGHQSLVTAGSDAAS